MNGELDRIVITINIPLEEKINRTPSSLNLFKELFHPVESSLKRVFPKADVLIESIDIQGQKALEC